MFSFSAQHFFLPFAGSRYISAPRNFQRGGAVFPGLYHVLFDFRYRRQGKAMLWHSTRGVDFVFLIARFTVLGEDLVVGWVDGGPG